MGCGEERRVARDGGCLVVAVLVGLIAGEGASVVGAMEEGQGGAEWVSCDGLDLRDWGRSAAMACVRAHAVLGSLFEDSAGRLHLDLQNGDLAVVSFTGVRGIVLLREAQACAAYVGEGSWDSAATRAAVSVVRTVARQIGEYAAHDCVVEVHRSAPGYVDFAVVDFIRRDPTGAVPGGVLAVRRGGAPRFEVKEIEYLAHAGTAALGKPRWEAGKFGPLFARYPQAGQELLRLGENGLVVERSDGRRIVVVLSRSSETDGWTPVEQAVCGRRELTERFRSSRAELRALLHRDDREIAIRALPGEWHEETSFEVGAYVMCAAGGR